MSHRFIRSTLLAAAVTAAITIAPRTALAEGDDPWVFSSCTTAGVCGSVTAIFEGSILSVRLANLDASIGSAMYTASLMFSSALNGATLGTAYGSATSATTSGTVNTIGTVGPWAFSGVGGSTELDLAAFTNSYIEGYAVSPYRAAPGDPDNGTWVTGNGYVQFTADLSAVNGLASGGLVGLGFCTDQGCVSGTPVATPEPATLGLVATGFIGLAAAIRRRKGRMLA